MNITRLILREILYRKVNFILAILAVVVAVSCLVAEVTILALQEKATEEIISAKEKETSIRLASFENTTRDNLNHFEQETKARLRKLEDDYRKITKKLGFNVLILSKKENLNGLFARGFAIEYMPKSYVDTLANSKIMTINHLLPLVQEMVKWKETGRRVLLTGISNEVPFRYRDPKKPLLQQVPKGKIVVGHELHRTMNLKKGQKIKFQGKEFEIHDLSKENGNVDDITLWINLEEAQEILGKAGKINAIKALECNCSSLDRLGEIRSDIKKLLPDTQVLESRSKALTRAEARNRAKKEAKDALKAEQLKASKILEQKKQEAEQTIAHEKQSREELLDQYRFFAAFLIPFVLAAGLAWLVFISLSNVRERQGEIVILRALGLSSANIYLIFISRAVLVGFVGAGIGYGLGIFAGSFWIEPEVANSAGTVILNPILLGAVIIATPLVSGLVGWLAAIWAVQQDPAFILQQA